MSGESYPIAQFDHVTKTGNLVFRADNDRFIVELNEQLERALLEAKQLRAEQHEEEPSPHHQSLPISQIQALIRAGADPDQVAEKYDLNSALVRRFSAPIESEKAYAIEQFLRVPAPKEAHVHSLAELIERTLAAARIPRESVQWKATRRGHEPWRIIASFQSAGHPIHAEWSWNMHSNTVACINNAARKLIGEINTTPVVPSEQDEALNEALPSSVRLPGDSALSARIELAVSAWNEQSENSESSAHQEPQAQSDTSSRSIPEQPNTTSQSNTADSSSEEDHEQDSSHESSSEQSAQEQTSSQPKVTAEQDAPHAATAPNHPTHASHNHRAPIPSWDEIMFGKAPQE